MARVFLSWGSPDEGQMRIVSGALRGAGLDVWDSAHDMQAGDDPFNVVLSEISAADTAIFLLSEAVSNRDWVRRELDWCYAEHKRRPQFRILPFLIGEKPETWPALIRDVALNVDDISSLDSPALVRMVGVVHSSLGLPDPIVLPAALFAMSSSQFGALPDTTWEEIGRLCRKLGMDPPLVDALGARYGNDATDFRPFGPETLVSTVERMLYVANRQRPISERPILLRWCGNDLFQRGSATEALWTSQSSLLLIDSISLAVAEVRARLMNLRWPRERSQSAVVWIPPYSRHTAELETLIPGAMTGIAWLEQAFEDFVSISDSTRSVAFDVPTSASLNHWLLQLLRRPLRDQPSAERVAAMSRYRPPTGLAPSRDFNRS